MAVSMWLRTPLDTLVYTAFVISLSVSSSGGPMYVPIPMLDNVSPVDVCFQLVSATFGLRDA
jgi:hypothetical protein